MTNKKTSNNMRLNLMLVGLMVPLFALLAPAYAGSGSAKKVIKQVTMISIVDPIPGHGAHQLALLLPPEPGKIFTGTLTYTASKPVEVVVFHEYHLNKKPDAAHGNVLIGEIGGKQYAISVMQFSNDVKATHSTTVNFAGSGLALHTLNGAQFTTSATINVVQESIQK